MTKEKLGLILSWMLISNCSGSSLQSITASKSLSKTPGGPVALDASVGDVNPSGANCQKESDDEDEKENQSDEQLEDQSDDNDTDDKDDGQVLEDKHSSKGDADDDKDDESDDDDGEISKNNHDKCPMK